MQDWFIVYISVLAGIQLLLPVLFAVWPRGQHQGSSKLTIARKEMRGAIYVSIWLTSIFGLLMMFVIDGTVQRFDDGRADAPAFALFAVFVSGITAFMIQLCIRLVMAKAHDVRTAKKQPSSEA